MPNLQQQNNVQYLSHSHWIGQIIQLSSQSEYDKSMFDNLKVKVAYLFPVKGRPI